MQFSGTLGWFGRKKDYEGWELAKFHQWRNEKSNLQPWKTICDNAKKNSRPAQLKRNK